MFNFLPTFTLIFAYISLAEQVDIFERFGGGGGGDSVYVYIVIVLLFSVVCQRG